MEKRQFGGLGPGVSSLILGQILILTGRLSLGWLFSSAGVALSFFARLKMLEVKIPWTAPAAWIRKLRASSPEEPVVETRSDEKNDQT